MGLIIAPPPNDIWRIRKLYDQTCRIMVNKIITVSSFLFSF